MACGPPPAQAPAIRPSSALLVRDDLQGRGIGWALVRALHAEIVAPGIDWVEVNAAADNRLVTAMIARRAPGVRAERDGATITYRLPSDLLRAALHGARVTWRCLAPAA